MNGQISFNDIKPGSYTLEASLIGYETESESIILTTGEEVTLNFTLLEIEKTEPE